jgi:cation diffusion facilitator family transporter
MHEGSRRAIIAAFFANLGIAISKFAGFLITGSAGLLAEAAHSLADTGNQGLLMLGGKRASRPADRAHPFGYGPERYFWAFVVALVLFSMGGLFALYEGIEKFRHPHEIDNAIVAFIILFFAIGLESFSLRTAVKESNHVRPPGMSWRKFISTSKSPELPVVLLEDVGAEIGLVFALVGLTLAEATGDPRWDALGSAAIGILLVFIAFILAREMKPLLIGESASETDLDKINEALATSESVLSIIHLRTMHLGPDDLLLAAKVDFDHSLSVEQLAHAIDQAEIAVRTAVPKTTTIYIEPDIRRQPPT